MLKGNWEEFTIRLDSPIEYDQEREKQMLEVTENFERDLTQLIKMYKRNGKGLLIEATDSEGRVIS